MTAARACGRGSFAVVKRCTDKISKKTWAVKVINFGKMDDNEIKALEKEISILRKVRLIRCSVSKIQQPRQTVSYNVSACPIVYVVKAPEYLYASGNISRQG